MKRTLLCIFCFLSLLSFCAALTPAYVVNGVSVNLQPDGTAQVPAICMVKNSCNFEEILISISDDDNETPPPSSAITLDINCDDLGALLVDIWAKDFLQQWTRTQTYIIVEDNYEVCSNEVTDEQRSYVVVRNGITLSLNKEGEAPLHVDDFIAAYVVASGAEEPSFAFSEDPSDTLRILNCDSPTIDILKVYALDGVTNPSYTGTYYTLNHVTSPCDGEECCSGSFSVDNGLSISIPPEKEMPIRASDLVISQEYAMSFAFSPNPGDSIYTIDCENAAGQIILLSIYGIAPEGNYSVAETYLIVDDEQDNCMATYNGPGNADVCMAYDISSQFGACEIYGHNISANIQPAEASPTSGDCEAFNGWCSVPQNTAWYFFEAPNSGSINIYTSLLSTQIALWEADSCAQLFDGTAILVSAKSNTDGSPANLSGISCLIPGQRYYLQIDAQNGDTGSFTVFIEEGNLDCQVGNDAMICQIATTEAPDNTTQSWQHFYDSNHHIIGSIASGMNPLGNINFEYQTHEGPVRTDEVGNPYLDRNWAIDVGNQPDVPVRLRLYFSTDEYNALQMVAPNIDTTQALFATRVIDGTCGPFGSAGQLYNQLESGMIGNSTFYIDFEIPGFSAFYLNGVGGLINHTNKYTLKNDITVFPNPTNKILNIHHENAKQHYSLMHIKLLNLTGQELVTQQFRKEESIDLSHLAPGTYWLHIYNDQGYHIEKIVRF